MSLRTKKTEEAYRLAKYLHQLRPLQEEPAIHFYKYWRVIKNRFPHDQHHTVNDMLVLNRKCHILKVWPWEWWELRRVYRELSPKYDKLGLNFPTMISIPDTVHFHLYNFKEEYK